MFPCVKSWQQRYLKRVLLTFFRNLLFMVRVRTIYLPFFLKGSIKLFVWKQPYVVIPWKCIPKKIKILKSIKRLTDSQMHRADKHSQDSSIIWPVWLNGWVFVYQLSGCGFESSSSKRVFEEFLFKIKMWSVCLQLY